MVRPILEYSSPVWSPWQNTNIKKIESIQKRAARFVLNIRDHRSISNVIKEDLKWQTLEERRNISRLVDMYKILHGDIIFPVLYIPNFTQSTTRSGPYAFLKPQTIVNAYKYSFFPATISLWNTLPSDVACSPSIEVFKAGIQQHF